MFRSKGLNISKFLAHSILSDLHYSINQYSNCFLTESVQQNYKKKYYFELQNFKTFNIMYSKNILLCSI